MDFYSLIITNAWTWPKIYIFKTRRDSLLDNKVFPCQLPTVHFCVKQMIRCIGKSTSGKKYQVEYATFALGKSTIFLLFPICTFSINNRKKYHIVFEFFFNSQISVWKSFPKNCLSISYRLTRLKVVLTEMYFYKILVCEFCQNWVFDSCHNLKCWVLSNLSDWVLVTRFSCLVLT